ncbi:MAG: hypothetical protein A2V69_01075 [Candidatus Portnoybacteria bacterium RBG_13_40_8]|uniref:DUF669 domain-containing protein n=1 Tax=Candidatus Portnoybacteria bacterium RBG_13_40_8 TaxID=1801990 RepID=A0A1G2F3Z6_9BACT|nr:MAG: hypothetical protein A2V69_01075 [Candidatus Portnoybacteria bacterium RBG_13_40_8]
MPITNDVKIKPSSGTSEGPTGFVPAGVYDVEISDITFIPGEENPFTGKPQLKLRFNILTPEYEGVEILSWASLTINPGWEQGNPSNLYKIAVAVMGEEPDMEKEFYPSNLLGGKLRVVVEVRRKKTGQGEYSKITNYLASPKPVARPAVKKVAIEEEEMNTDDISIDDEGRTPPF